MARDDIKQLYEELITSEFMFVPRGKQEIGVIYEHVKSRYSHLCDDDYLCAENCQSEHYLPEWQHAVRRALDRLKRVSDSVSKGDRHRVWILR